MSERKALGKLIAAVLWIVILGVLALAYKFFIHPRQVQKLEVETGSESQYRHAVNIAADSFTGYAFLRSQAFKTQLKSKGIKVNIIDDRADYAARIKSLKSGAVHMAAFTIDSLILSSVKLGEFPATIVMVIDESNGADAIVAHESVKSIQQLDNPEARIVLTPSSPSDFLARVVIAHFSLPSLPQKWWIEAQGAEDVYKRCMSGTNDELRAYVLWEPFVSKAVSEAGAHILLDSSKLKGYIVDVLVSSREFLKDHPDLVKEVIEAYLRSAYSFDQQENGLVKLVSEDAKLTGSNGDAEAKKLATQIRWKNTLENYAHFGLLSEREGRGLQSLEDMINNIMSVLVKTGALAQNPLQDKAHTLFFNGTLKELQSANFHPARTVSVFEGIPPGLGRLAEVVRADAELPPLNNEQWKSLVPVGELSIKPISFARGTSRIHMQSERQLEELALTLTAWPQYYLVIQGNVRAEGDADANTLLAQERADAAREYLLRKGIREHRIRALAAPLSQQGGEAQSVSFVFGQTSY